MRSKNILVSAIACAIALAGAASPAFAVEKYDNLQFTANVMSQCQIVGGSFLYNLDGASDTANHPFFVQVKCNEGTAYSIGLDNGYNRNGNPLYPMARSALSVEGNGYSLAYNLWQDPTRVLPWEMQADSQAKAGVGNGLWQQVEGNIEFVNISRVPTGDYGDLVRATIVYDGFI